MRLWGVEAADNGNGGTAARISAGSPGYLHGAVSYVLQNGDAQMCETHSIAAGLDYPGVGPEHAHLHESGRVHYVAVSDEEAGVAFRQCAAHEGIIPALETAHHSHSSSNSRERNPEDLILVNFSGRGDKDIARL